MNKGMNASLDNDNVNVVIEFNTPGYKKQTKMISSGNFQTTTMKFSIYLPTAPTQPSIGRNNRPQNTAENRRQECTSRLWNCMEGK
jgi:hypothetical protein